MEVIYEKLLHRNSFKSFHIHKNARKRDLETIINYFSQRLFLQKNTIIWWWSSFIVMKILSAFVRACKRRFTNKLIECYECLLRLENQSISFVHTECCTVQWLRASELMNIVPKCYFYIISNVCVYISPQWCIQIWIMWLSACFYCSVCVVIVASHIYWLNWTLNYCYKYVNVCSLIVCCRFFKTQNNVWRRLEHTRGWMAL